MLCKNTGTENAKFKIDGAPGQPPRVYDVPPGGTVDIAEGYCRAYRAPTQRPMKPIIVQLHPAMRPMGEATAGEVTPAPAPTAAGNAEIMAALTKLTADVVGMKEENRALRRENAKLRGKMPDNGAGADEAIDGDPDPDGIATSPAARPKARDKSKAEG